MKTKQKYDLPTTDTASELVTVTKPELVEQKETKLEVLNFSKVDIPLGPLPGYVKRRVDVGRMTRAQSEALASITTGLQFNEARLKDGSPIKTEIHAIRWVLEQVGK